jgi:hypothetical protein
VETTNEDLHSELGDRLRKALATSHRLVRESAVVIEASRYARNGEKFVPRCAWCGRIGVGGEWLEPEQVPVFLSGALATRTTHGICPDCFGDAEKQRLAGTGASRVIIHAGGTKAAEALAGALAEYAVETRPDHVLEADLGAQDESALNRLLSRIADCLRDNALEPVRVRLSDRSYPLGGR